MFGWLIYVGVSLLSVYASSNSTKPSSPLLQVEVNLESLLGTAAFAGFTAATGAGDALQDVLSWQLTGSEARVITPPPGGPPPPPPNKGLHGTATQVICNLVIATATDTCTATVGDASVTGQTNPTGTVHFTSSNGGVFSAGNSCNLAPTPFSGSVSSCSVQFLPPTNASAAPAITASYQGDATHGASSGRTSYPPASSLGGDISFSSSGASSANGSSVSFTCRACTRVALHVKAAVIYENGDPDVLRYEDIADPECPEGCVLIDVEAISIEGGDLLARAGSPPPSVPHVVGYLAAGTIVEVAAGVEQFSIGDRVVTMNAAGSHASKRAVPAMTAWPIPNGMDLAAAACVPVAFGTAEECLFTAANLQAGQTVLIHAGAGGVGMAAIQLAKQAGATVLSTASSDEKLERLKELGLDHGINYATESFAERTRELTNGTGADVILDSVGGRNLVDSVGALAYRGTLVSVGLAGRAGSGIEARELWARNNALRGVFLGGALMAEYPRVHAMTTNLIERVAAGELRVHVDRTFPLAEAAAAHAYIESRAAFGRVVMSP